MSSRSKNILVIQNVGAGQSYTWESTVVPNGARWHIKKFGAIDINIGDHKSSIYKLKWGSVDYRPISLTGNTYQIDIDEEIVGDGSKKLSVQMYNTSGQAKQLSFWIKACELG